MATGVLDALVDRAARSIDRIHHAFFVTNRGVVVAHGSSRPAPGNGLGTLHAEEDAMDRLRAGPRRSTPVDLVVIRLNSLGAARPTKPCWRCVLSLATRLPLRNYRLRNVAYFAGGGRQVCEAWRIVPFSQLLSDPHPHVSRFYRERGWIPPAFTRAFS